MYNENFLFKGGFKMKLFLVKLQRKIWQKRYSRSFTKVVKYKRKVDKAINKYNKINNELNRLVDLENSLK